MSSRFVHSGVDESAYEGWSEKVHVESRRFNFYKVRINGVLLLVKEPKPDYTHDLVTIESLRKEFTLGFRLSHPGIPRYYDFDGYRIYEEFIEGDTLRELIERKDPLLAKREFLSDLCHQLLNILDYLHRQGILHLDIKPENLILTSIGRPQLKLIDFGSATNAECDTTPGFTPEYKAPEQPEGPVNFYTDLFQVGVLMRDLAASGFQERRWRKFVTKATATAPLQRFASTSEAKKYIPSYKRNLQKRKILMLFFVLPLASGAIVAALLLGRDGATSRGAAQESDVTKAVPLIPADNGEDESKILDTDTVSLFRPINTEHQHQQPTASYQPAQKSVNREATLKKEIKKYIDECTNELLLPVLNGATLNSSGTLDSENRMEYRDASLEVYYRCMDFMRQLSAQNPTYEEYIKTEMRRMLEYKIADWNERYFSLQKH